MTRQSRTTYQIEEMSILTVISKVPGSCDGLHPLPDKVEAIKRCSHTTINPGTQIIFGSTHILWEIFTKFINHSFSSLQVTEEGLLTMRRRRHSKVEGYAHVQQSIDSF